MIDPGEYDLEKTPAPASGDPRRRSPTPWLLAAAALFAGGAAIWFFVWGRQPPPQPAAEPAPIAEAAATPTTALCGTTDAIALPALDDSDTLVSTLVGALSAHPRVTAWLATDNLIRNFTVVVENVASGA
ncbi:MAG: hypothetical protein HW394_1744, partial [Acidobacteria bacterium]|nr:hypothetical protein [Acidobacteriota bacterium]